MRRRTGAWAAALALLALTVGCGEQPPPAEAADEGDFVLVLEPAEGALAEIRDAVEQAGFAEVEADLNALFALPADIPVVFTPEAGEIGPHFDPETNEIVIPYAFVPQAEQTFEAMEYGDDAPAAAMAAIEFVLYHEVGHALVVNLDLPITGREEDAVDGLAALIMTEVYTDGQESVLAAADWFAAAAEGRGEPLLEDFAAEHSLDEQRYFRLLCWVFGSDPDAYGWLVEEEYLPAERAETCPADHDQNADAWSRLLGEHLLS